MPLSVFSWKKSSNREYGHLSSFLISLGKWVGFLFIGFCLGTFIFFASALNLRYTLPILGALFIPLLGVFSLHFKRFFQALLVISIPLLVRKTLTFVEVTHTGGPVGLDILLSDYILFVLYSVWVYEKILLRREGEGLTIPRIGWYLLAFIIVAIFSISNAKDVRYSIFEVIRLTKVFLFFIYISNHFNTPKQVRFAATILSLIVIVHSTITFAQRVTGYTFYVPFVMLPPVRVEDIKLADVFLRRPGGIFGNANSAAAFLSILLPTVFSTLFWKTGRFLKIIFTLAFALGLAALVDTYSRGGWITIPPACITLVCLCFRKRLLSLRRHLIPILAAVFLGLVLSALYAKPIHRRLTESPGLSAYSRLYLMKVSCKMIITHPIIGNGVNNFNLSFVPFSSEVYDPHSSLLKGIRHIVHNVFFLVAADMGLTGLTLFLLILYEFGKNAWAGLRSRDPFVISLSVGLLTSLQSFCIVEMFDFSYVQFESILFMFWVLIAFSVFVKGTVSKNSAISIVRR